MFNLSMSFNISEVFFEIQMPIQILYLSNVSINIL